MELNTTRLLLIIFILAVLSGAVAGAGFFWPARWDFTFFGRPVSWDFSLRRGLDLQGGLQVVLEAQMDEVGEGDRQAALESAKAVIERRVDFLGVSLPRP